MSIEVENSHISPARENIEGHMQIPASQPASQSGLKQPNSPKKAYKGKKRRRRRVFWSFIALVIIILALLAGLFIRLATGEISSQALANRLVDSFSEQLPEGWRLEAETASVYYDSLRGFVTALKAPQLSNSSGGFVVKSASISTSLRLSGLMLGQVGLRDIEIDRPVFSLLRLSKTRKAFNILALDAENPSETQVQKSLLAYAGSSLAHLHNTVGGLLETASKRGLERITILDGDITAVGPESYRHTSSVQASIRIFPEQSQIKARATGIGNGGVWQLEGEAMPVDEGFGHEVKVSVNDLILPDLIPAFAKPDFALRSDAPLSLYMRSKYVADNNVPTAEFKLELAEDQVHMGQSDIARMDGADILMIWSPELEALSIEQATLRFGPTILPFEGYIRTSQNNPLTGIDYRLAASSAVLAPRDNPQGKPVNIDLVGIDGQYDTASRYLSIDRLEIRVQQAKFLGSANIDFQPRYPSIAGAFSLSAMPVETFKQIWPPTITGGARRWFIQNVSQGIIEDGELVVAIPAGLIGNKSPDKRFPPQAFQGSLEFADIKIKTFGDLPAISAPAGQLKLDETGLVAALENGLAHSPSAQDVQVPSAILHMPVLGPLHPLAQVSVTLAGKAQALAEMADSRPLHLLSKRNIEPEDLKGDAVAEVKASFLLARNIDAESLESNAVVRLSNFSSEAPLQGRRIENGDLLLEIDEKGMALSGKADLDGFSADVDLFFPSGNSQTSSRTDVKMVLDDAARQRLGMDLGGMLAGPTPVEIGEIDAKQRRLISVDLTSARLALPSLGWSKGVGVAAKLDFLLLETQEGYKMEEISLSGEGFGAAGHAQISAARGLERLVLERLSLRPGDAVGIDLRRTGAKSYHLSLSGSKFDGRGVLQAIKKGAGQQAGNGSGPFFKVDGSLEELIGFGGKSVRNVAFSFETGAAAQLASKLSAKQADGSPILLSVEQGEGGAWLSLSAGNAGEFTAFLDVTEAMRGGQLSLSALLGSAGKATVGQLYISDFEIGQSQGFDQLAQSLSSRARQGNGQGSRVFERARFDFTVLGDRLTIDDAHLRGPAHGITLKGVYDMAGAQLALNGVFVPAYGLNNAFSRVPVLGSIMGGERNQGLLGVTFRISGTMQDPVLTVNPVSAIAPGVFRRIFEFR